MERETNVLEYLERSAGNHGDKVAFCDLDSRVTYSDLHDRVMRIGTSLHMRLGVTRAPIAVMIDRNVESICCFLGVVASGNFYVPLDGKLPTERLNAIVSQMRPRCIVSIAGNEPRDIEGIDVFRYEDLADGEIDAKALACIRGNACDADPLYAICTSGSTGVPKGVLVPHRAVLDFIPVFAKTFSFDEYECFGNQAPFDFDVSVKDIFSTLYCGASMYVIPKACFTLPKKLPQVLDENKVSTIIWAVSALCVVSGFDAFKYCVPKNLKKVLFSGEAMPVKQLNVWKKYLPDAMYVNLYGPTEITCNCMYYVIDKEFSDEEKLPLGVAFPNERVVVLDSNDKPVSEGQIGEVCVMGTCLALGYYRDPAKTSQSFVQNPLNDCYPELMYRTGDLARLVAGEYYFAGRRDFQIKHMGHRIELEEIELHLNSVTGVDRACCLFDEKRNKIVAFFVGDGDDRAIAKALLRKLPKYMLPNVYHRLEVLPITKNGKINRSQLKEAYIE